MQVSGANSTRMGWAQFLETVAALCAGLQVPVSINRAILGAAYEPWSRLHNLDHAFGWRDATDYLVAFERAVELDEDDHRVR